MHERIYREANRYEVRKPGDLGNLEFFQRCDGLRPGVRAKSTALLHESRCALCNEVQTSIKKKSPPTLFELRRAESGRPDSN